MWAVSGNLAAYGCDVACVDSALVSSNVAAEAFWGEDVPEFFNKFEDSATLFGWAGAPF